jgi:hypothetical protein
VHRVQVGLDQRIVRFLRKLRQFVDRGGVRRNLLLGQSAHRLAERHVFVRQGVGREINAHAPIVGRPSERARRGRLTCDDFALAAMMGR